MRTVAAAAAAWRRVNPERLQPGAAPMQPLSHVCTVEHGQGAGLLVHTPTAAIHRTLAQGVCMLAFRRSLEVYYGS